MSKGMDKLEIYRYQLEDIQNALRLCININKCHTFETCFDRNIMQAKQMVDNALDGNIDKQTTRLKSVYENQNKEEEK